MILAWVSLTFPNASSPVLLVKICSLGSISSASVPPRPIIAIKIYQVPHLDVAQG
jgi:hypothetical protein